MDRNDKTRELERQIEQAQRIALRVTDQTTADRLRAWIYDLRRMLNERREAKRIKEEVTTRAHEIWEQHGRPSGRDLEFWLLAESEISRRR